MLNEHINKVYVCTDDGYIKIKRIKKMNYSLCLMYSHSQQQGVIYKGRDKTIRGSEAKVYMGK